MPADKKNGDGLLRQDFLGGWTGDSRSFFDAKALTKYEKEAYSLTRRLLHWRRGNTLITEGRLIQAPPMDGVYVYQRVGIDGKSVTIIMNGTNETKTLSADKIPLSVPSSLKDFFTEKSFSASSITIAPHDVLLLQ